jgi:hypothetical protein
MFLFCLNMESIYVRLRAAMGESSALYTYCDDSYLMAEPDKMTKVMKRAPAIYGKSRFQDRLRPGKTDLILPQGYEWSRFS